MTQMGFSKFVRMKMNKPNIDHIANKLTSMTLSELQALNSD
jgi:hypothetical protein